MFLLKMSEKTLLDKWLKLQEQIKMEFDKYRETRFWSYQMNVMEEKMVGLLWEFGSALQTHQQLEDLWKERPSHQWMIDNLDKLENIEHFLWKLEKFLGVGVKEES